MPEYVYTGYHNPNVAATADLMLEQGRIAGQALNTIAAANARAAELKGQAYGQAAQAIGNIPNAIQQTQLTQAQLLHQKAVAAEDIALANERNQKIAQQQRETAAQGLWAQTLRDPNNLNPDTGHPDPQKVYDVVSKQYPVQAQAYLESAQRGEKTRLENEAAIKKANQDRIDELGRMAMTSAIKFRTDTPINARDAFLGNLAAAVSGPSPMIDVPTAQQAIGETAKAPPSQQLAIMEHFIAQSPAATKEYQTWQQQQAVDAREAAKEAETERNARALNENARRVEEETQRHNRADEAAKAAQLAIERAKQAPGGIDYLKRQELLEQQFRSTLGSMFRSRSGEMGIEDIKVGVANHALSAITQYYDPKTGDYNIPRVALNEIALDLAKLHSPTGQVGAQMEQEFKQPTAFGLVKDLETKVFGKPLSGTTQAVAKMYIDAIVRQGEQSEKARDMSLGNLQKLAPTDLEPRRVKALSQAQFNPLIQYQIEKNSKGEQRLSISNDKGETWIPQ